MLDRLHEMWRTDDKFRRPQIAYLMCQLGDNSGVDTVSKAFFAGDYYYEREIPPDNDEAGSDANDEAYRLLILYGTQEDREKLLDFLHLADDPLRKGGDFCEAILGLSSEDHGPGLPTTYPIQRFPLDLAIACLDYTVDAGMTVVVAPGGTVHAQLNSRQGDRQEGAIKFSAVDTVYSLRECDNAAQAIQNLTSRDFGFHPRDSVEERDNAIARIKKWWAESKNSAS